jgi:hypothetical protein
MLAIWQQRLCYHLETSIKKTFDNTTQYYKSVTYENQLFPTHSFFPALRVKRLKEDVCTDSFEFKEPRAQGHSAVKFTGQLFVTRKSHMVQVYWLPNRKQVPAAIEEFFIDVGVPDPSLDFKIHFDRAGENHKSTTLLKRKYIVCFHHSEPDRQHQNPAEQYIQEVKKRAEKLLSVFGGHECLEYLMCNHIPDVMNIVMKKSSNWKSPIEKLTGKTPDISNFRFHWWEPIWFLDSNKPFFE